jgi:hypothetical protein
MDLWRADIIIIIYIKYYDVKEKFTCDKDPSDFIIDLNNCTVFWCSPISTNIFPNRITHDFLAVLWDLMSLTLEPSRVRHLFSTTSASACWLVVAKQSPRLR